MPDLLLELFSEEIPARMQRRAAADLQKLVTDALVNAGLLYEGAKAFATPRRLALTVHGLPARSPDQREEKKGPRVGAPEQAITGFLKAAGLASIDQAKVQPDKKGDFYVAVIDRPGRPAGDVIADILPPIIRSFPWPKAMRWGAQSAEPGALTWVRPLHSILCVFGPETEETEVVPFEIGGIRSGNLTQGHRFLAPAPITVRRFADYLTKLEAARVVLDADRRKAMILADAKDRALAAGLELVEDEGLLEEVAGLVEWPVVLMGEFEKAFLDIPPEVIRTTIRNNQKCFVLNDLKTGRLANRFVMVANIEASDGGRAIAAGNGRVIRSRLADARYFWETDLRTKLADRLPKLDGIVFHEKLGTQGERVRRITALAKEIAPLVGAHPAKAARAAELAKADLVTEMVGEFPELQGVVGKYYALKQGEDAAVATAIEDHYKPLGPADRVPADPVAIAVALADKLDTLVGFWAIDEKPTGSKDPFALRRAALGVIRIVLEKQKKVDISSVTAWAIACAICFGLKPTPNYSSLAASYDSQSGEPSPLSWNEAPFRNLLNGDGFLDANSAAARMSQAGDPDLGAGPDDDEEALVRAKALQEIRDRLEVLDRLDIGFLFENRDDLKESGVVHAVSRFAEAPWLKSSVSKLQHDLLSFFADRLKVQLREQGARHDLVDAVFALGNQDDLLLIVRRVEALGAFLDTDDGKNLLAGYKRATNILRDEEKKAGASYAGAVDARLLAEPEEKALAAALDSVAPAATDAVGKEDFAGAMSALAGLRAPVDAFFEKVRVNADDAAVRENRLRLLNRIREATLAVADFSRIAG